MKHNYQNNLILNDENNIKKLGCRRVKLKKKKHKHKTLL